MGVGYKDKIRKEVLKSFEPLPFLTKYKSDLPQSSLDAIEAVKEKNIARAIDEYEQKNKLGKYNKKNK